MNRRRTNRESARTGSRFKSPGRLLCFPVAQTINEAGEAAERAAVADAGGFYLNTQPWFCAGPTCGVMVDNIEMWRDDNHVSAIYSAYLGPAMAARIARVMPGG